MKKVLVFAAAAAVIYIAVRNRKQIACCAHSCHGKVKEKMKCASECIGDALKTGTEVVASTVKEKAEAVQKLAEQAAEKAKEKADTVKNDVQTASAWQNIRHGHVM